MTESNRRRTMSEPPSRERAHLTRRRTPAITEKAKDHAAKLGAAWPEVGRRLSAALRARCVPEHQIDDVVQEVAIRALSSEVAFESAQDLYPWARVVALRLVVDHHRREARLVHDQPDREALEVGPALVVESRLRLAAATRRLDQLSPDDRAAIVPALVTTSSDSAARSNPG